MKASGYDDGEEVTSAKFVGMTGSGWEIHQITFPGEDGEEDDGVVYVKDGKGDF